ncbi:hypothetical protein U6J73_05770 [Cutibacterium acnes]|nr:hypothetical protein [Cutibacterium acnes]MDF2229665.1 hypothetical protein [Cutibacterium acnes subsp. defendens]WHE32295.1 hypothetical protein O2A76_01050 [Cutibacterium acnes subsp. acnes]
MGWAGLAVCYRHRSHGRINSRRCIGARQSYHH